MSGDHLWPILFGISLAVNVILLLYRPVLAWLRRDKGEELADEIMAMVEEGEESGAIEQNEKELIANIFEFNSMTADDVMRHRTDMVTLALDDDDQTILDTIQSSDQQEQARSSASGAAAPSGLFCTGVGTGRRAVPGYAEPKDPHGPGGG